MSLVAATPVAEAPQQQGVKRGQAELSIDESAHEGSGGTELSPLAKRIAKVKKVSDPEEYRRKQMARACLVRLVDWACKHEDQVPTVWNYIETGMLKVTDNSSDDMFADAPRNFRSIEKAFKAQFLISISDCKLTSEMVTALDARDEHAISDIFSFATKTVGTEVLPPEFIEQSLLMHACKARHSDAFAAAAFPAWVEKHLRLDGKLSWFSAGPFTFEFCDKGVLMSVTHHTGAQAIVPKHMFVDATFSLRQAPFDTQSEFHNGPVVHTISKLFAPSVGPNQLLFDRKGKLMKSYLDKAKTALAEARRATTGHNDGKLALRDTAKEKRAAALEKAREKLKSVPGKQAGRVIQVGEQIST